MVADGVMKPVDGQGTGLEPVLPISVDPKGILAGIVVMLPGIEEVVLVVELAAPAEFAHELSVPVVASGLVLNAPLLLPSELAPDVPVGVVMPPVPIPLLAPDICGVVVLDIPAVLVPVMPGSAGVGSVRLVHVPLAGPGLRPGAASSVAPMGMPIDPTGAPGVMPGAMPSGDVVPMLGIGPGTVIPRPPAIWACAAAQPRKVAVVATINTRFMLASPLPAQCKYSALSMHRRVRIAGTCSFLRFARAGDSNRLAPITISNGARSAIK